MRMAPTASVAHILLAMLTVLLSAPVISVERANESDPILERSWLEDKDGALSPQQALQQSWTPFDEMLSAGLTQSTIWVRLLIDPSLAEKPMLESDQRLVLNMLPVHLDEVAAFESDRLDEPPVMLGDKYLQAAKKKIYQNSILFERVAPFEVLLRIRTQANLAIFPFVSRWDDAREYSWRALNLVQLFVFALLAITFASLLLWINSRSYSLFFFIAQLIMGLLVILYLHGFYQLSDINWVRSSGDRITTLLIPLEASLIVSFHSQLMKELGARRSDITFLRILIFGLLISATLVVFGWTNPGLIMHHMLAVGSLLAFNVVSWRFKPALSANKPPLPWLSYYLRFAYFLMFCIPMLQFIRVFTGIDMGFWTLWAYTSVLPIGSFVMGIILVTRYYSEKINFASDAIRSKLERQQFEAQSDLIAMLAHELKTPLSVISLALSASKDQSDFVARAKRGVTNMRNVLDHCEKALSFDYPAAKEEEITETEKVDVCELVSEVVNGFPEKQRVLLRKDDLAPICSTNKGMLLIVANNLIENALKYSPEESVVTVDIVCSIESTKPGVIMTISNVVGAAGRPDSAELFKKYYRSPKARQQSGSGLGLFLSYRMATRFGAVIRFREAVENVVFELYVPLKPV
jgi:signal transduction histidine kinase